MATIKDVARLAGVTHTTVSHALSGKRPVAPATRDAILAAVRQLDYHPNANALSLTARRTQRVCLAVPLDAPHRTLSKGPVFDFIAGVGDRLSYHGYTLVCEISRGLDAAGVLELVRAKHVDGTLLLGTHLTDPRVDALRRERFPFVTFGRTRRPSEFVRVDADAAGAAALAVQHLFELGHRRIALVLPLLNGEPVLGSHYHALAGFKRAHKDYGLPVQRRQILTYNIAEGLGESIEPLVDGTLDVSAVIAAGNDLEAVTVLRALTERGRRVPDDVSLVGLVDSPLTQLAQPSITVTDLPVTQMCNLAVDLLIDLIEGRKPRLMEHILPVKLLVRPSTQRVGPALSPHASALAVEPVNA
jgi:DNA-binding LacI/PurR family transcriptional regulator